MKRTINIAGQGTDTKKNIRIAGAQLFVTFGVRAVSIDDICGCIGISKRSFYSYFPDKTSLLKKVCEEMIAEAKVVLEISINEENAIAEAHYIFDRLACWYKKTSNVFFRDLELK